MKDETSQRETDLEHLRLLGIFFYVQSAIAAICATFPVIHLVIGIGIVTGGFGQAKPPPNGGPPPELFGWIFVVIAGLAIILGWTLSIGCVVAARSMRQRKRYTFCMIMSGIACLHQPTGTILGVLSLIVLARPSVKRLFREESLADAAPDDEYPNSDPY